MIYLITSKLDRTTLQKWHDDQPIVELPSLQDLFKYLHRRCSALKSKAMDATPINQAKSAKNVVTSRTQTSFVSTTQRQCSYCASKNHWIYRCKDFNVMPTIRRLSEVNRLRLCINCLRMDHQASACPTRGCSHCGKPHHSSLHDATPQSTDQHASSSTNRHAHTVQLNNNALQSPANFHPHLS